MDIALALQRPQELTARERADELRVATAIAATVTTFVIKTIVDHIFHRSRGHTCTLRRLTQLRFVTFDEL
jgi:hypothetical protein